MSSPHDHQLHGHADERDPPTGSPALTFALGGVIFLLICLFLIGIERSWRASVRHELDAPQGSRFSGQGRQSFGDEVRARQEAQLQAGVHQFPKGDANEAMNGKRHIALDDASSNDAFSLTIQKYGKR